MKPMLLILAAGMGSRYGWLKQIDAFWPAGESIIEYSIYDAIRAGFGKVVYVIREEFESDFRAKFWHIEKYIDVEYVFQSVNPVIGDLSYITREKPWWTGHAILSAKDVIDEPFVVIYADDYCGIHAFELCHDFLQTNVSSSHCAVLGFELSNTLSPYGGVNRWVLYTDVQWFLLETVEVLKISLQGDKAVYPLDDTQRGELSLQSLVNMWSFCFDSSIFSHLERLFFSFARDNLHNPKAEFFLPTALDDLVKDQLLRCSVIATPDQWCGVSYREDKNMVSDRFATMVRDGNYPSPLWQK